MVVVRQGSVVLEVRCRVRVSAVAYYFYTGEIS